MAEEKKILIPGRLKNAAVGGHVAGTEDIYDDELSKTQNEINSDIREELSEEIQRAQIKDREQDDNIEALNEQVAFEGNLEVADTAAEITDNGGKVPSVGAVSGALKGVGYFECNTAASTANKTIAATGYSLRAGGSIKIKMVNANTADNATLTVGSTAAKPLFYGNERASAGNTWEAGEVVEVYYDSSYNSNTGAFYANNVAGGSGDGAFDISKYKAVNGTPATYRTLTEALGTNGANVPSNKRKGGMTIKYIQLTDATYSLVKTEGLDTQPTGVELQSAISLADGVYTGSQLPQNITLPQNIGTSTTYYLTVTETVDEQEVTTYTMWVVTKLTNDVTVYVQWTLKNTVWSTVQSDWVGKDETPTEGSTNWVTSGGLFNATTVGNNVEIDLTQYTAVRAFPNPDIWVVSSAAYPYYGMFIPVKAGQKYLITANSEAYAVYGFLTTNTYSHNASVSYATGCTRVSIPASETVIDTAPSDAKYIWIGTYTTYDITPESFAEYHKMSVKDYLNNTDATPTENSVNLVTSGGVHNALPFYKNVLFQNTSSTAWSTGNINSSGSIISTYNNKYYIIRLPDNLHEVYFYREPSSFDVSLKVSNSQTSGYVNIDKTGKLNVEGYKYLAILLFDKPTLEQAQAEVITVVDRCLVSDIDNNPTQDSINLISSGGVYDAMYIDRLTTGNGITWIQGGINGQTGVYETNAHAICTEPIFINGDANASVYPGYLGGYNVGIAVYDTAGTFKKWGSSVDISSLDYLVGYVRFIHYGSSSMNPTPSNGASTGAYVVKHKMIEQRLAALEKSIIKTYSNPVCAVDFPDPTIWDGEDGYYYALATGSVTERTMKRSANLVDWEDTNDLPYTSDVADAILSNFGSYTIYWAPCVYKVNNNQWNMYLSKPYGGVAILTSSYPTMGYQFIRQTTAPFRDYIDADVARDRDGKLWMFAGSAYMMHRRQMTDNGLDFAENSSWEHVAGRPSGESGNTNRIKTFEGEYLYRRGGYWYLFCSSGEYDNNTYAIRVVRSQTLNGTFVDKEGNLATEGYAETIMSSGSSLYGPGHNAQIIVDRDNKTWMLYHSHWSGASSSSHRGLCLNEVKWDENGWPYFEGGVPSLTHVVPSM